MTTRGLTLSPVAGWLAGDRVALIIKLPSMEDLNRYKAKNVMDYYDKSVSQSVK